ncbi:MAG: RNA polymerase sigma factor [Bacteroidetes bacterium]|nr:RNA polymerase sigma factor [Bacteroidota bacterium]MDA1121530.1 RNA polymerase sigma factor [Bacteroidota bacterium]
MHVQEVEYCQRLIQGCLKGDRKCQELLYKQFYSYGMSISYRYASNSDEANEILNDGFMKVFKNIKRYNPERPFKGWFRTILINTAINQYKKYLKHANHSDVDDARSVMVNQNVTSDLGYRELLGLVQKLTPSYRTVFCLYVIDGFNHEEIADQLGISVGSSKSNLSRARVRLQEMLMDLENINYAAVGG